MMLAEALEGIVTPEGISVIDSAFPGLLSDDRHQFFLAHVLHNPRIHLAIAFQQAKYDVFTLGSSATLPFASAAEVGLVHLHLAIELATFKLGNVIDGFAELLIQAGKRVIIEANVAGKTV